MKWNLAFHAFGPEALKSAHAICQQVRGCSQMTVGRLMFNMLRATAEFETDLRRDHSWKASPKAEGRYKGLQITINGEAIIAALGKGEQRTAVAKRFLGQPYNG